MKKKYIIILIAFILIVHPIIGFSTDSENQDDPIITLSYFNYYLNNLESNFNKNLSSQAISVGELEKQVTEQKNLIGSLQENITNLEVSTSELEVVELFENQKIILEAGSEIILRAGTAYAIEGANGDDIPDITSGKGISQDSSIPINHLLLIPRSDGRGVYVDSYAIFMVKGVYEIIDF